MKLRALKENRGQSAVEFSLTLVAFLVMLFGIGDMIHVAYNWMGIQFASNRGARLVKLLPTAMDPISKMNAVEQEVIRKAAILGISLNTSEINTEIVGSSLNIETVHTVSLSPLAGLLLQLGGDHSGSYPLRVREAVRNESI